MHIDNKKHGILILMKGSKQGLDDTTITAEVEYSFNFLKTERKFCLSLHYNESKSFLYVNSTKMYQCKAKDSEIKPYSLCLENISKKIHNPKHERKTRIKWFDISIITNIHKRSIV